MVFGQLERLRSRAAGFETDPCTFMQLLAEHGQIPGVTAMPLRQGMLSKVGHAAEETVDGLFGPRFGFFDLLEREGIIPTAGARHYRVELKPVGSDRNTGGSLKAA